MPGTVQGAVLAAWRSSVYKGDTDHWPNGVRVLQRETNNKRNK